MKNNKLRYLRNVAKSCPLIKYLIKQMSKEETNGGDAMHENEHAAIKINASMVTSQISKHRHHHSRERMKTWWWKEWNIWEKERDRERMREAAKRVIDHKKIKSKGGERERVSFIIIIMYSLSSLSAHFLFVPTLTLLRSYPASARTGTHACSGVTLMERVWDLLLREWEGT